MPTDIILDDSFIPVVKNGDLVAGESTRQHQKILLLTHKGELRESPLRGVGLRDFINEEDNGGLRIEIKREFESDGMAVKSIKARDAKINVEALYE